MYRVEKRKKGKGFVLLLFLCVFAVGMGIGYGGIKLHLHRAEPPSPTENETITRHAAESTPEAAGQPASLPIVVAEDEPVAAEHFYVAMQQGDVCVFNVEPSGEKRFSHKLAIELDALPQADRAMLADGIYLDSKEDLLAFCEDFAS